MKIRPIDPLRLKVYPLEKRESLSQVENVLVSPDSAPPVIPDAVRALVADCADKIAAARKRGAGVMLIYGAHLLRNGAAPVLEQMLARNWLTHLATNGAGAIHDWEYAWLGRSLEGVQKNVAAGTFGTWDETGRNFQLALMAGALRGEGFGASMGRFIIEDGITLPTADELESLLRSEPTHPLSAARADLLQAMRTHKLSSGRAKVEHRWKQASVLAQAFRHGVPLTIHPGIGYDIITNHPMFNGAVVGRAGMLDFHLMCGAVETLDGGVVLSIGSATMGPQVFEKSLSCVHNLRAQEGRPVVSGHGIYVVDLQDGGNWDWTKGEPPKTNPAYYLRFCKSFVRMGGSMHYVQSDNMAFLHNLYHQLTRA